TVEAVLVTEGDAGMTLYDRSMPPRHVPTLARAVYDVTGAGDTVVATLSLALAAGADLWTAVQLANLAAGPARGPGRPLPPPQRSTLPGAARGPATTQGRGAMLTPARSSSAVVSGHEIGTNVFLAAESLRGGSGGIARVALLLARVLGEEVCAGRLSGRCLVL